MSQLLALISVVRTVRQRLADVEDGVVSALKVPQMALKRQNLQAVIHALNTVQLAYHMCNKCTKHGAVVILYLQYMH